MAETPPRDPAAPRLFLTVDDLRALFGQARADRLNSSGRPRREYEPAPLSAKTIWTYVTWSRTGPYKDRPMPMPTNVNGALLWLPQPGQTIGELERDLLDWYADRH